jgi:hypothetical protein
MAKYYEVKDVLAVMFEHADDIMAELSADSGAFTFKRFLQTITQRNQLSYIELLQRCTKHPNNPSPFNAAHQHIGSKTAEVAQKAGFARVEDGYVDDIFGNRTKNIVYRKRS